MPSNAIRTFWLPLPPRSLPSIRIEPSNTFLTKFASASLRFPTQFVSSLIALLAAPLPASAQDEAIVDILADILAAEDSRRFDVQTLRAGSIHPDPIVRRHAALALGRLGDRRGTAMVLRLVADPDTTVHLDALFALGLIGDSSTAVIEALRPLVLGRANADPNRRREAMTAVAKIQSRRSRELLDELFDGPLPTTGPSILAFAHAASEMWRLGSSAPAPALNRFANSGIPEIRKGAIYALFRLRSLSAAGIFLGALGDADAEIRGWAARVLTEGFVSRAQLDRSAVAEQLATLLRDGDAGVRVHALGTIATYADPGLAPEVMERLTDRNPGVVTTALTTLAALDAPGATEAFLDFVDRGRIAFREPALLGLVDSDRPTAIRKAAGWIQSQDWVLRMGGVRALAALAGDTAVAWLVDLTTDTDVRVASAALAALGTADSGRARAVARRQLFHPDLGVRAQAVSILGGDLSDSDAALLIDAYAMAERDGNGDVRLGIIRALGQASAKHPGIAADFFQRYPSSGHHLARRAAATAFSDSLVRWGAPFPIETGRTKDDYRQIVRRFLLPAERGDLPKWELETERGRIQIDLFAAEAPLTVNTFFQLTEQGYFNGGRWHRVVPNFVIQDGDPRGDGTGGPGFTIRDELNRRRYGHGYVGMALGGPETGGSQFFITLAMQPHLDGTYTVFGRVRSGLGIVDETTQGDRIRSVRVRR